MQLTFGDAEGLGKRKQTRGEIFLAEMVGSVAIHELGQRQSRLKLHDVDPHLPPPLPSAGAIVQPPRRKSRNYD